MESVGSLRESVGALAGWRFRSDLGENVWYVEETRDPCGVEIPVGFRLIFER